MFSKLIRSTVFLLLLTTAATAQKKVEFDAYDAYPEGIAYDASGNVFYVSGVTHGTIGKVNMAGNYTEIFRDTMLRSTYGMKMNADRTVLWVCAGDANYSRHTSPQTHKKMIRLIAIDPASGRKIKDIDLSNLAIGNHFANDFCFDGKGNIYITDSFSPNIYKVDEKSGEATVFATSPMFYSANIGLNGIVFHPSGYLLAVNSGAGAVMKININDPKDISAVKVPQFFTGGDGLILDNNNTLTLVQNQSVNKIFKLVSNDNWMTAKVTMATKSDALFQQPSTAVMVGQNIWVMNSKLNELADSMHVPSRNFSIQRADFVAAQ